MQLCVRLFFRFARCRIQGALPRQALKLKVSELPGFYYFLSASSFLFRFTALDPSRVFGSSRKLRASRPNVRASSSKQQVPSACIRGSVPRAGPVPHFPMVSLSEEDLSRYLDESVPLPAALQVLSHCRREPPLQSMWVFSDSVRFARCPPRRKPAI